MHSVSTTIMLTFNSPFWHSKCINNVPYQVLLMAEKYFKKIQMSYWHESWTHLLCMQPIGRLFFSLQIAWNVYLTAELYAPFTFYTVQPNWSMMWSVRGLEANWYRWRICQSVLFGCRFRHLYRPHYYLFMRVGCHCVFPLLICLWVRWLS